MDEDAKFILKMGVALLAVLVVALALSYSWYSHPMPGKDCSKAYDYPICGRAYDVEPWKQPNLFYTSLYVALALLLMAGLVYVSFKSCVLGNNDSQEKKKVKNNG